MPSSFCICRSKPGSACASSCWRAAIGAIADELSHDVTTLSDAQIEALGEDYNTPIHLRAAPEIAGGAVNERPDRAALTAQFEAQGAVAVDDLLTPQALDRCGASCWKARSGTTSPTSTASSRPISKTGSPVRCVLQIADELRQAFPDILGPASADAGLGVQGPAAAVGGRRPRRRCRRQRQFLGDADRGQPRPGAAAAWSSRSTPPPADWQIRDYDADQERIVTFLEKNAGNRLVVPYRQNRAVLFRSRLFHHSDRPKFAIRIRKSQDKSDPAVWPVGAVGGRRKPVDAALFQN